MIGACLSPTDSVIYIPFSKDTRVILVRYLSDIQAGIVKPGCVVSLFRLVVLSTDDLTVDPV